jgi:hypothetical protein
MGTVYCRLTDADSLAFTFKVSFDAWLVSSERRAPTVEPGEKLPEGD